MKTQNRKLITFIICLALPAAISYFFYRSYSFRQEFHSLKEGQSKQEVINSLGKPKDIHPCLPGLPELKDCSQILSFNYFVDFGEFEYIVALNADNKAIAKYQIALFAE
jgi:hypothetical protein